MKSDFIAFVYKDYQSLIKIASDADLGLFIRAQICQATGDEMPEMTSLAKALYDKHMEFISRLKESDKGGAT